MATSPWESMQGSLRLLLPGFCKPNTRPSQSGQQESQGTLDPGPLLKVIFSVTADKNRDGPIDSTERLR